MKLNWTYDPITKIAKTVITDQLFYTTNDGGQTILKFVNDELVSTFHKYGPDLKFSEVSLTGKHTETTHNHEWDKEVSWLSKEYPEIVGEVLPEWDKGFLSKDGSIIDVGIRKGYGVVSPDNPISINRLCQPANEIEGWDYEQVAWSKTNVDDECPDGVQWIRHKTTGQLYRMGVLQPMNPCCVFPKIHGPYQ